MRIDRRDAIQEELPAAERLPPAMADGKRMMEKWGSTAGAASRYYERLHLHLHLHLHLCPTIWVSKDGNWEGQ